MAIAKRQNKRASKRSVVAQSDVAVAEAVGPGQLVSPETAVMFMLAGRARVTLVSKKTGTRFTYQIRKGRDEQAPWFVAVMTGPDNESSYSYLGTINSNNLEYRHGRKSGISPTAPSAQAFNFAWLNLQTNRIPVTLEVWHEGRCGCCCRTLTVPESLTVGLGPECRKKFGL